MRLWHYKLLPYIPNSQLIAQWRELNAIFNAGLERVNHILINYVKEYPYTELNAYAGLVLKEMQERNLKIGSLQNFWDFIDENSPYQELKGVWNKERFLEHMYYMPDTYIGKNGGYLFKNHHTNRYLLQCFYNLQEKYDRGQKDFDKNRYEKLKEFVENEQTRMERKI